MVLFWNFEFHFILSLNDGDIKLTKEQKKYVLFLGKVDITNCPGLYAYCDFLFLPTLLESFSASYCEAMKMKKPIITSDLNFARGICDDSAVYFDPISAKSIGDSIYNLSKDHATQKKLITNGTKRLKSFSNYNQRASKYLNIIKNEANYSRP